MFLKVNSCLEVVLIVYAFFFFFWCMCMLMCVLLTDFSCVTLLLIHLGSLEDVESLLCLPKVPKSCSGHTMCVEKEACEKRASEA